MGSPTGLTVPPEPVASTANPTSISPTSPEVILTNPVIIVGYDPTWPATFQQLRDRLAARLGPLAIAIEHVGSTAVPGLAAKPIIDLDVVIADRTDLPTVIQRLRSLGYHHEGDLGVPGREAFITPAGAPPHHLYVCAAGTPALNRHLAFRDTLRANAELAQAYGDLKRDLAAKLGHDRAGYTEAKTRFVEDVPASASTALPRQPIDPAAYERRAREGPCFVCQTLAGHPVYPGHFVWTDDDAVAFLARYNTLLGHTLVAPRAHREQVTADFTIEEYLALQRLVYRVGEAIRQDLPTERLYILNLGSQSGNPHVHWHVAPLPPGIPYRTSSSPPSPGTAACSHCPMTTWQVSPDASALASSSCTTQAERGATSGPHAIRERRQHRATAGARRRSSPGLLGQRRSSSGHPACL